MATPNPGYGTLPFMPQTAPVQQPAGANPYQPWSPYGNPMGGQQAGQQPPKAAPPAPAPAYANPTAPGVQLSSTNPSNSLLGQTITPGPMTNRYQIAQQQEAENQAATDPYYQQSLREATSQAAGAGQLGSGQLRTSLGDLANQRNLQLQTANQQFLTNALNGSIQDAYNNIGIAQQQQGFQAGLQNQGFEQGLQSTLAGTQGNPADTALSLSGIYSNQAGNAGNALGSSIQNSAMNQNSQQYQDYLNQILSKIGNGGGSGNPTLTSSGSGLGGVFNNPSNWVGGQ